MDHVSMADPPLFSKDTVPWSVAAFTSQLQVLVTARAPSELEFDLVSVDASIANAFRRILIAEVPTMAIETVYVSHNTSVVQDEVLAQRLGLVPLRADARLFAFREGPDDPPTDQNTLVFSINVRCGHNAAAAPLEVDPLRKFVNSSVYSGSIVWAPQGEQAAWQKHIAPVHDDILLAKLRPGQAIIAELHCQKGIGKEHAKWSPVATASYRLLPHIEITAPITGVDAHKFKACFPPGVVKITAIQGVDHAEIDNPRRDTASRECLRHKEFEGKVRLSRVRNHFLFAIESTGAVEPHDLFDQSIDVLIAKCVELKKALLEI